MLRAEKEVTLELRRLSNLEIYPVAELAQIRREHEAIAKEWRQVGSVDRRHVLCSQRHQYNVLGVCSCHTQKAFVSLKSATGPSR